MQINLNFPIKQQILFFAFIHVLKIQSIHKVKLYISHLCIPNVVFDFCPLPQIMFFTCGFLVPLSTMYISISLRGKGACALAV